jgi:uncharacterized NAD(P)/FAD-binding protein YdhS
MSSGHILGTQQSSVHEDQPDFEAVVVPPHLAARATNDDSGPDNQPPPSPAAPGALAAAPVAPPTQAIGISAVRGPDPLAEPSAAPEAANDTGKGEVVELKTGGPKTPVVIIGGGPAGFSAAEVLKDVEPTLRRSLDVYIVDDCRPEDLGRGAPFGRAPGVGGNYLLMNMFTPSVQLNKQTGIIRDLLAELGTVPITDFMKRCDVGDVLARRATRILGEAAACGLRVEVVRGRAIDISPGRDAGVTVYVQDINGRKLAVSAQAVILTVGNAASPRYERLRGAGFVDAPWSEAHGIHRIPKGARVAIAGSSLAGMDVASVLLAQGHRGPIVMFSPSAKLAGIRPLHAPTSLKVLAPERLGAVLAKETLPLTLDAVLRLIRSEFEAQGQSWSRIENRLADYIAMEPFHFLVSESRRTGHVDAVWGVQKALDDIVAPVWHVMAPQARQFVLRHLSTFAAIQWSAAPPTAHRVMAMLNSGQLTLVRAADARRLPSDRFAVVCQDGTEVEVDCVVDASGFAGSLNDFRDPLIQAMCRRGLLTPDETGLGARVDFEDGRLLDAEGLPAAPIWAGASALTRGTFLLSNELGEATHSAVRSAQAVVGHLKAMQLVSQSGV